MKTQQCWISTSGDIALVQAGRDNFTVIYGMQIEKGLTYSEAAKRLGCAIMHAAACDGRLDNRERNER